jgi:hypothetical protein
MFENFKRAKITTIFEGAKIYSIQFYRPFELPIRGFFHVCGA